MTKRRRRTFNKLPRSLKVINVRFPQFQVSIVSLVNRKEVAYVVSYFTVFGGVSFLPLEFFSQRSPAISNCENAKFTRRAAASWLEYSTKEKENRERTGLKERWRRFRQTNDSLIQSTRRRKYFTFRYHLTRGSKKPKAIAGSWRKNGAKGATIAVSLFDSHQANCGDNFNTFAPRLSGKR